MTGQGAPLGEAVASPASTSVSSTESAAPSATATAGSKSSPAPSETAVDATLTKDNTPWLYVADNTIHDGPARIDMNDPGDVSIFTVDRLADGYLVGITENDDGDIHLLIADSAGSIDDLGRTTDNYDITPARTLRRHGSGP